MSLGSWWRALAKERTKRVQSRTTRTIAREESAARKAEARYGGKREPQIVQDTGQLVMDDAPSPMSGYLPLALGLGLLVLMNRKKD
jgi:hypothetical protein